MLQIIVDERLIYVVSAGVAVFGVLSKVVSNLSLKRMVKAAGNMSKSNHSLMRLIRAKFEHACMVSEKVENVGAFVDKYLYEYKAFGLKLHTWQSCQKVCVALCFASGLLGALVVYLSDGMSDNVIRSGAVGAVLGILLYLFHMTSDEEFKMTVARNYMVDYLENVCLHKYEKLHKKEEQEKIEKMELKEEVEIEKAPEITVPEEPPKPVVEEAVPVKEKKPDKDVLIRQILEEFMA